MKRIAILILACASITGCSHRKPNPVTLRIEPPAPVYLQPAQGRVVSAILIDLPPSPAAATGASQPPPR